MNENNPFQEDDSLEQIAVIGMAGSFPGADTIDKFWSNLRCGVESIFHLTDDDLKTRDIPKEWLQNSKFVRAGTHIEHSDEFDANFFGYSPREALLMDPQQRMLLEKSWEALENAGYSPESFNKPIGVFVGTSPNSYYDLLPPVLDDSDVVSSMELMIGNELDFAATRISYKLNLKGPSLTVQTACSTSLTAVQLACQSLLTYQCNLALAGGASLNPRREWGYFYQEGSILSPDGHCRAFDARAGGTVIGQGVGLVVLKRLSEALADGDSVYSVIRGCAINNDGALKIGYTAPSVEGQAEVIAMAHAISGISADSITYIEAHGTGTRLGDPIEIAALTQAFRASTPRKQFCAVGSLKTNIGHADAAAGIAGLIKTVLMLWHKEIPPSLHFETPNPEIDFSNSPFYVPTRLSNWELTGFPRRAGVSSLGIGGTNVHAILEEAPATEASSESRPWQMIALSAKTAISLDKMTSNLSEYLEQNPSLNIADVAYTLQVGRKIFNHRRMVVCQGNEDAVKRLRAIDQEGMKTFHQEPIHRDIVFMFSGQGSQYANMGLELYETESKFREEIDICSKILRRHVNLDLRDIIYPNNKNAQESTEKLKQTFITQPALFVMEYALAKLWMSWGIYPKAMIGHSIGEYVAACLSGVLALEDALSLVAARGRLMQELPHGSMLAIPLPEKEVQSFLNDRLSLAVVNGPSLCVVSGEKKAIEALEKELSNKNVNSTHLHTSHAFHSYMMEPILEKFAEEVGKAKLNPPQIPFISNVSGTWVTLDEVTNPKYWVRHLRQTVRFSDGIEELLRGPDRVFLEVGPGHTLCTLVRQHQNGLKNHLVLSSIRHPKEPKSDVAYILNSLGHLWLAAVQIDWNRFYAGERRYRISLPTYPFERKRYWIDTEKPVYAAPTQKRSEEEFRQPRVLDEVQIVQKTETRDDGAPTNSTEKEIAYIWKEILGVNKISIHHNFFNLGGNSLNGAKLITKIKNAFGVKLPLGVIFEAPTVAELAVLVQKSEADNTEFMNSQKKEVDLNYLTKLIG
ncbi:MAG: polyketide synthase [Nitrospirae bacterium RBG_13_39_12]|nr:MAG: polyketide synthase [Nitrospirae bacterium RBG_13_39_12]